MDPGQVLDPFQKLNLWLHDMVHVVNGYQNEYRQTELRFDRVGLSLVPGWLAPWLVISSLFVRISIIIPHYKTNKKFGILKSPNYSDF
jgi:hypothetical protein